MAAAADSAAAWFSAPRALLPAPTSIVRHAKHKPTRAYRPPALAARRPAEPPARKARSSATQPPRPPEEEALPELRDRALLVRGVIHLRHGRYLHEGRVVAVPQRLEDFQSDCADELREILLVELSAPRGAWLEDPEVALVHVSCPAGERLLPVEVLRRRVRASPNIFRRPLTSLKKLDCPFRSPLFPEHLLLPLATSDFEAELAEAREAPCLVT
jgi:hypothetical protein